VGESPDIILPLPATFGPVKRVRSTLLISSCAALRERGSLPAYLAALPPEYHAPIVEAVAGVWIPIEVAQAHYNACGTLGLTQDVQVVMGRQVGARMHGTLLGTVVRMAKEAGVSPWTVLPQFQRFWMRAFDGGAFYAEKLGPKEVHLEVQKVPLVDCTYFRVGLSGLIMGVLDLFCQKSYVQERGARKRTPGSAIFRVQWA